jgi:hypothetical protein
MLASTKVRPLHGSSGPANQARECGKFSSSFSSDPLSTDIAYRVSGSWMISGFDACDERYEVLHRHMLRVGD